MVRFAFIVHPIAPKDVARKFPVAKLMPDEAIEALIRTMKPSVASHITGVRSITGAETEGVFIGLPMTPRMFLEDPIESVYDKIVACCDIAASEGCEIIGLGAFTSVVGDGGQTVASRSKIAVTTGNSYTVATAIEGTLDACGKVGLDTGRATLAVVGATGAIGRTCAISLSSAFARTILVGRDMAKTEDVAAEVERAEATTEVHHVREADVIVTVTSSENAVIQPADLKPGAVVCDVARPRDVSTRVAKERPDVLVIEGGVVSVPGDVDFGLDFGFPPKTAYACMSETMMLALDGRPESFTLGKGVSVEQVQETQRLAAKHGFHLAGYRSFEKEVGAAAIQRVRAARLESASV